MEGQSEFGDRSAVQIPIKSRTGGGGETISNRSVAKMDRQHEIFLRSVKQKTNMASPMSPLSPNDLSSPSPSSLSFVPATTTESSMRNQLQELERRLLCDDEDEATASDSVVTNNEWGETISSSSSSSSTRTSRQLLLDTAAAIGEGNLEAAAANMTLLKRAADARGDPEQRLTAIMVAALSYCLNPPPTHKIAASLYSAEYRNATYALHETSPCFKFALLAANFSILDAARDHTKLHVIDFDLGGGAQLATLIHALAGRHVLSLRITAVADPTSSSILNSVTPVVDRLKNLADRVGISLRFSIVSRKSGELDRPSLRCEPDEALAVNLPFVLSRVADESVSPANPRDELLRSVRALSPQVVALVEQEMNSNTSPFSLRFAEACGHYGALLESLVAIPGRVSVERIRIEAAVARKAVNVVACEGADRVERCEVFGKWRARMGMAGFRPVPLGAGVVDPVRARLESIRPNPGFMMSEEDNGGIGFGYMGRILTYASAWR